MLNDPPQSEDVPDGGAPVPVAPEPGSGRRRAIAAAIVFVFLAAILFAGWQALRPLPERASAPGTVPSITDGPGPTSSGTTGKVPAGQPAALAPFYGQDLAWKPCEDISRTLCATATVPVDYARPEGEVFTLALRKVPALDPDARVGSLLVNPGGPGGSGVDYAPYASHILSKDVLRVYDVIGFDPRGIGASDAVGCLTDSEMDTLFTVDPTPDTPAEEAALRASATDTTEACARAGGTKALHMSSLEVAHDMDVLRAALGDAKLNYYGVSYGTVLGALYADQFPDRVGRLVLDSAISPNQTDEQEAEYDIQGFESSFGAFLDWCTAQATCALGTDRGTAEQKLIALIDAVDKEPLTTTEGDISSIGEGWFNFAIFMCLYSSDTWPTLNAGLAEAMDGNGDRLLTYALAVVERDADGGYARSTYLQAMLPVRCADWARSDPAWLTAFAARTATEHPLYARMSGAPVDMCDGWPGTPRAQSTSTLAKGADPILVIGNLRDPATPIGGTKQLAADLDSGVLVTSDNDGHGTYFAGDSCVDDLVDGYLVEGRAPKSDTAC